MTSEEIKNRLDKNALCAEDRLYRDLEIARMTNSSEQVRHSMLKIVSAEPVRINDSVVEQIGYDKT